MTAKGSITSDTERGERERSVGVRCERSAGERAEDVCNLRQVVFHSERRFCVKVCRWSWYLQSRGIKRHQEASRGIKRHQGGNIHTQSRGISTSNSEHPRGNEQALNQLLTKCKGTQSAMSGAGTVDACRTPRNSPPTRGARSPRS